MCKKKTIPAVLLSIALILSLAACGGGEQTGNTQSNVGENVGGVSTGEDNGNENNTYGDDNGGNDGEETIDPGKQPFEPGDGDSLKEFAGLWADYDIEYPVYIQEDGTWGKLEYDGKKAYGIAKYENGKITLAMEDDGRWEVAEYTPDQDGNLISEVNDPLYRYSWVLPKAETVEDCYVGYWKDEQEDLWLCVNRDATWYEVDASGKIMDEGYVCTFCMQELEEMIILVHNSTDKGAVIVNESDDHLYGDRREHNWSGYRTVNMPGNEKLSPVYTGIWKFTELDIAVHLREDSTWASYSPYQELIAVGELEPNQENNEITLALDGKNAYTFEMYNIDYMQGDNGGLDLVQLNPDVEQKIEERFLGMWKIDWLKQYITINEDLTWNAKNIYGETISQGSIVVNCEYGDEIFITLMREEEGFPLSFREAYSELHDFNMKEYHLGSKVVEVIPETAKYAGMYYWEAQERYVRVNQEGDITDTYRLDGTFWDTYYAYYNFDAETGVMSMTLRGNVEVSLLPNANGGWADATGTHQLVPVDFVPSLDEWGRLPIEDAWYYEAKDVYLTFEKGFGFASDGPIGDCLVMDENGKDIARGTVTFGPDAVYTVIVEGADLNVVLTLDREGRLTDAAGNELVKAHNIKYRN